jgi:hypothetical protein
MTTVSQITVGEKSYNVPKASAAKQKTLLSLIGAKIAFNSAAAKKNTIDAQFLFGALISEPEDRIDTIAGIVLLNAVESGKDIPIDVGSFQDRITEYYQLIAIAILENLQDFFTYLDGVNAEARKAPASKVQ